MKCYIINESIYDLWMNGSSNEQMDEQMDNVIICEKHSFSDIQYGKVK
jgi:hypothetical protein